MKIKSLINKRNIKLFQILWKLLVLLGILAWLYSNQNPFRITGFILTINNQVADPASAAELKTNYLNHAEAFTKLQQTVRADCEIKFYDDSIMMEPGFSLLDIHEQSIFADQQYHSRLTYKILLYRAGLRMGFYTSFCGATEFFTSKKITDGGSFSRGYVYHDWDNPPRSFCSDHSEYELDSNIRPEYFGLVDDLDEYKCDQSNYELYQEIGPNWYIFFRHY